MTRSTAAAGYAAAYQAHADAWSGAEWGPFVISLLGDEPTASALRQPVRPRWCDLCCGTGQLLAFAGAEGFDVTGIDHCPAMLGYAAANAPGARLIRADATNWHGNEPFEVVTCLAHSINHLTAAQDAHRLIARAGAMLKPDGRFVFDLLTPVGLRQTVGASQVCYAPDRCTVVRVNQAGRPGRVQWTLTSFVRMDDESFDRFDHAIELRGYAPGQVDRWLARSGLTATRFDAQTLDEADAHSLHLLYCCRRA